MLPHVRLLPGENHRERVLSIEEEAAYLDAAADVGHKIEKGYQSALKGIRALERGQQPKQPDSYLLRDVATVLIDCALRPEECFRLKWENFRDGLIDIHKGKGRGSRRRIPASQRVQGILEMRKGQSGSDWIFPAPTRSGHIEASSIKKQHAAAIEASEVHSFVLYTLRHTCLTRWAKYMDPFTLHILAGHTDMNTTKRYIHPNETHIREAMAKVWGGHSFGHSDKKGDQMAASDSSVTDSSDKDLTGATRRDRTGDLLITNQPLCVCTGLEAFVFVCIFNSLDVPRHNQGKCFHAGGGHKNGHSFLKSPDQGRAPPLNPNSWLRHLPMLFALDVLG